MESSDVLEWNNREIKSKDNTNPELASTKSSKEASAPGYDEKDIA